MPTYLLFFFLLFFSLALSRSVSLSLSITHTHKYEQKNCLRAFQCNRTILTKEEILSRPFVDVTRLNESEVQCMKASASTSTDFNLKLSVKRKSSDVQSVNCHFVAVTCIGRKPTHFLITFGMTPNNLTVTDYTVNSIDAPIHSVQSTSNLSAQQQSQPTSSMPKPNTEPRGSLHGSIRRGEFSKSIRFHKYGRFQYGEKKLCSTGSYTSLGFDARSIASENIRRTSLAKLSALPLEAPITKV